MAQFNPEVPKTDSPSYLGYSQPVSQPEGDKTLATVISGASNLIEQGVKATDYFIKDSINKAVRAGTDTIGGIFTAGLESIAGTNSEGTLVGKSPEDAAPYDVRNAGTSAGLLKSAAEAGKLTPTSYYGKLTQLAKDLRSQHPGYVDYIDKQISEATGIHPANAYMKSLLSDINAASTKGNADQDKKMQYILKEAPELYQPLAEGKIDVNTAMVRATQRAAESAEIARRKLLREDNTGSRDDQDKQAQDDAQVIASTKTRQFIENIYIKSGLDTPMTIKQVNDAVVAGKLKLTEEQSRAVMTEIMGQKAELDRQLVSEFNSASPGKTSIAQRLKNGMDDGNKIISNNSKALVDLAQTISDKEFGTAFGQGKLYTSRIDAAKLGLISDPGIGYDMTATAAMRAISGDQYIKDMVKYTIQGNFDERFKVFYNDALKKFIHQSDIKPDKLGNYSATPLQVPYTVKNAIDDGLRKGVTDAKVYEGFLDFVNKVSSNELNDASKIQLIKAGLSEGNLGMLNRFPDKYDPVTGKPIVGQYTRYDAWQRLTSSGMLSEVKRISDKYDPALWPMAKNYVETEFSRELFAKEIQNLNEIQDGGIIKLAWDSDKHRALLEPLPKKYESDPQMQALYAKTNRTITTINQGLEGVRNMSAIEKGDADAYVIGLLGQAGFNVKENMPGLPTKLAEAIRAAHAEPSFVERLLGKTSERVPPNQPVVRK